MDLVLWPLTDQEKLRTLLLQIWVLDLQLDKLRQELLVEVRDWLNTIRLWELNKNWEIKGFMLDPFLEILVPF